MKRSTGMIAAVIAVVLVLAAAAWLVMRPDADDSAANVTADDQPVVNQPTETPAPPPAASGEAVTISYTGSGFEPSSVTIKSGQTVTFTNKTSNTIQPASDPHPQHTDNSELNVGNIPGGGSKSITPKTTGIFEMHDHFNPSNSLKITVQ